MQTTNTTESPRSEDLFAGFLHRMSRYLKGDLDHGQALTGALARLARGEFDTAFRTLPKPDDVHLTTSCHLLAMSLHNRLEGLTAETFYKADPLRYVRSNLFVQRALGIRRLTLGWPVYAFGAEAVGQTMMYPADQAPGSDPGQPMLSLERPDDVPDYDSSCEIAVLMREMLLHMARLGDIEPVAHLPAPYSLAAELVGQENLILALSDRPDSVSKFLDALVERVLAPWCADLVRRVPAVWLELSDASGSPMFIGPRNFLAIAAEPVQKLRSYRPWGERVFVANYRGDRQKTRRGSSARGGRGHGTAVGFLEMTDAKRGCCPWFLTRLEADQVGLSDYLDYCIRNGMTLYVGIGATRVDRHSITDRDAHISELADDLRNRSAAILAAREAARERASTFSGSWPGDLYLEDTNAESDLDLIAWISSRRYQRGHGGGPR